MINKLDIEAAKELYKGIQKKKKSLVIELK